MYKIPDEVIQFIEKTWRVELTAGSKSLAVVKIQRGTFQGDTLSPLLFVIAMMPLSHIIRKCIGGYQLSKSPKNQPLNVHRRHQTFCQKRKRTGNPNTDHENMQSRYRNGIRHGIMRYARKQETTHDGRIRTTKSRKIKTLGEKETYKFLGILEADTIKQVEMKEKIKRKYLKRTRKQLEIKLYSINLIKWINTWAVSLVRYSGSFLKWSR